MPNHADLTGAELHEPKGVASASSNTIYTANGSGSGAWIKVTADMINGDSIKNTNRQMLFEQMSDITDAANKKLFVVPQNATLIRVDGILSSGFTSEDNIITLRRNSVDLIGTITVTQTGSAEGDKYSLTPTTNNTFVTGNWLTLETDGGGGGSNINFGMTFTFELT